MKLSDLSPADLDLLEGQIDDALGFTLARAKAFLEESRAEAPTDGETDVRRDAIGKHKHFLRVKRGWHGAVDAAWPFIEKYAALNVDAVLAAEGKGG